MKSLLFKSLSILLGASAAVFATGELRPFPQSIDWPNCIKPSVGQASMDASIASAYDSYKKSYLKKADVAGQYYVYAQGNPASSSDATVSEQHGYAMILFALMGGYDDSAKIYFDGCDALRRRFPSTQNSALTAWKISLKNGTLSGNTDDATDGDLDMAYALLLADKQWGGSPAGSSTTYLDEAKTMIAAFTASDNGIVDPTTYRTKLGDWSSSGEDTRSSDWMVDHMRAFKAATSDALWDSVELEIYSNINDLTGSGKPGSSTGLVSDFGTGIPLSPDPSGGGTGENNADQFDWNGCRYPWRMTMAFQQYGSAEAKAAMDKLMTWASGSPTGGDPSQFNAGYTLSGSAQGNDQGELAFVAPITLAGTIDAKYQSFLDNGWTYMADPANHVESYGDAINLLCMLAIAGDWWNPTANAVKNITTSAAPRVTANAIRTFASAAGVKVMFAAPVSKQTTLSLVSAAGRSVIQTKCAPGTTTISLGHLASGCYFVKLHSVDGISSVGRIVIQ